MTTPALDITANLPALLIGLRWLYDTEQPTHARQDPHGQHLPTPAGRTLHFIPSGTAGHVLIVIEAAKPASLAPGELAAFADLLDDLGETVLSTYNGYPGTTAALALARPAHPTLRAAVARFADQTRPWLPEQTAPTIGLRELQQHALSHPIDTTALTAAAHHYLAWTTDARNNKSHQHITHPRCRYRIGRHTLHH
ncbi:Uncharacterised protein [Mycobacteroides abscessus subsp. abscessus]|uniref:hypothetical protein n=1 Tax=Mycobacteriaceae TaxID=1762 RepID=UPI0009A59942|nr:MULTISPECIES: hypothetical protein [Mycobacteriaceae]KAB7754422.1 hypothetical protein MMUC44124_21715 [Mycolicibacterium mucogenicum DSM 44124]SLE99387.1 Uncharacterised protein [Mycobacteroides abscessus subsp. abscessus]